MYVLQNNCQRFIDAIRANTEKPVLVFNDEQELIDKLCKTYGSSYDKALFEEAKEDLEYIMSVLQKVKYFSNLTCEEFFLLEFYSKYMTNLKMRREYFEELEKNLQFTAEKHEIEEITSFCPRGNYENICKELDLKLSDSISCKVENTALPRIKRVWKKANYGYTNCPFDCEKKIGY